MNIGFSNQAFTKEKTVTWMSFSRVKKMKTAINILFVREVVVVMKQKGISFFLKGNWRCQKKYLKMNFKWESYIYIYLYKICNFKMRIIYVCMCIDMSIWFAKWQTLTEIW